MDNVIFKVYVKIDSGSNITAVNSSIFLPNITGWTQIDEGAGDKYAHAQGNYLDKPLMDVNGCYNYKLVDGKPVERSEAEKQADTAYIEKIRAAKLAEISVACQNVIYAGTDVADTKGTEHFSLTMADQTNLSALAEAVAQGAASVPYHADGQLCRMFSADEIKTIFKAAKAHVTQNVTWCNHLNAWVRRCTAVADIQAITYTSALPDDLMANYKAVLSAAGGAA